MTVDLLRFAHGKRQALFLDDQIRTVDPERDALDDTGIEDRLFEEPQGFFNHLQDWFEDLEDLPEEERTEQKCLLVVDVNMSDVSDIREVARNIPFRIRLPRVQERIDTNQGQRAGIVLVDLVIRRERHLRRLPIIVLSAYELGPARPRLEEVINRSRRNRDPEIKFMKKDLVRDEVHRDEGESFKNAACDLVYDPRLLFLHRLAAYWELSEDELCAALGVRSGDVSEIANFFDRGHPYGSVDPERRTQHLYSIQENLHSALDDRESEVDWLRSKNHALDDMRPIDLLTSTDFSDIAIVRTYVSNICGR